MVRNYVLIYKYLKLTKKLIKLNEVDADGSGSIEFPEFLLLMALHTNQEMTEDEMREAFRVFDKDERGNIPEAEIRNVLAALGEDITEEEIEELILEGDADGDGCINYGEFITMMTWPDKLRYEAEEAEELKRQEEEEKRIAALKGQVLEEVVEES